MTEWKALFQFVHLAATVYMAAPLYALLAVNERARLGAPLNYNTDRYMENLIRHQARRCFIVLATVLATGLLLIWADGFTFAMVLKSWTLWTKLVAVLALFGLLSYVHFYLQPRIEGHISQLKAEQPAPQGLAAQVGPLRLRRKRLGSICLFTVLAAVIMGLRLLTLYPVWLTVLFLVLGALFAYRTFKAPLPYGWF